MNEQPVVIGSAIDTPTTGTGHKESAVDLAPYKAALLAIVTAPPMTKALPVELSNARGFSAASVKKHFHNALEELNGNVPDVNTQKVKLVFRNANPGEYPIKKFYVKWTPDVDATTVPETVAAHVEQKKGSRA